VHDPTGRHCDQEHARQHEQPPDVAECHAEDSESEGRLGEDRGEDHSRHLSRCRERDPGEDRTGHEGSKAHASVDHDPSRDPPQRTPDRDLGDELEHGGRSASVHDDAGRHDQRHPDDHGDDRHKPPPGEPDADLRSTPDRLEAPFECPRERRRRDDEQDHADDTDHPQLTRPCGQGLVQQLRCRVVESQMLGEDRVRLRIERRTQCPDDDQDRQDRREHVGSERHAAIDELQVAEIATHPQREPPGRRPHSGSHHAIPGLLSHTAPHEA
jgi:hypothetical protein